MTSAWGGRDQSLPDARLTSPNSTTFGVYNIRIKLTQRG